MLRKANRRASQLALLFLCPFFFSACQSPQSYSLQSQKNPPSSQLLIVPKNVFQDLGFEILQNPESRKVYVFVKSKTLRLNNIGKIPLKIEGEKVSKVIGLIPLKGGQKAWMPFKSAQALLKGLEEGKDFTLSVEAYHLQLQGKELSAPIKKLKLLGT